MRLPHPLPHTTTTTPLEGSLAGGKAGVYWDVSAEWAALYLITYILQTVDG